jgi:SAM-dependent methyltransferase
MERADYHLVANEALVHRNPMGAEEVEEIVRILDLPPGARVLDIGCGKGELLVELIERYRVTGVGVEFCAATVDEVRRRAAGRVPDGALTLHHQDANGFSARPGSFDLAASVGARAAIGEYAAALARLRELARPGGLVLLGEAYWDSPPTVEYAAALGLRVDTLTTYEELIQTGIRQGLVPIYAVTSSPIVRSRYQWQRILSCERYASEHPDEPGMADFVRWIRAERDHHVFLGGRQMLGFGMFLFRRDDATR